MGGSFARGQRRRKIGTLTSEGLDRALEIDRRFFARFPARRHRLRLATQAEVDGLTTAYGARATRLGPGDRWFAAVKQLGAGRWLKCFIPAPAGNETDVSEEWAALLYDRLAARGEGVADLEAATLRLGTGRPAQ